MTLEAPQADSGAGAGVSSTEATAAASSAPRPGPTTAASGKPMSPGAIVEENILPTPNSVDLMRSARGDYMLRFERHSPHVAELFQENTKLVPQAPFGPGPKDGDLAQARAWYMATAYRLDESAVEPGQEHMLRLRWPDLGPGLGRLCSTCGPGGPLTSYLYAVDLMLWHAGRIVRVVPAAEFVWLEKRVRPDEDARLRSALLRQASADIERANAFMFVVGVPWRYMMFLGPRGYRHMMLDAGAVLSGVQGVAQQLQLAPRVCLDFYDTHVDRCLLLDGVERTTLAVVMLEVP